LETVVHFQPSFAMPLAPDLSKLHLDFVVESLHEQHSATNQGATNAFSVIAVVYLKISGRANQKITFR
jgi:hypothetical protein